MKIKLVVVFLALQLYIFTALQLAFAQQTLVNITEDTLAQDSYRPVAGKEFLVAVKLSGGMVSTPETVVFMTDVGVLSETEVQTNFYGEAFTWLTTADIGDTLHTITATVKDQPAILPIAIGVKNIALPQNAPAAEQLVQQVDENNAKIQDVKSDIAITSNRPESSPLKQVKIWRKGNKQKVEEISPNPAIYIRPDVLPLPATIVRTIVAFNPESGIYAVCSKEETQGNRFPYYVDYIDNTKGVIVRADSFVGSGNSIRKFVTEDGNYVQMDAIWVFMEEKKHIYQGIGELKYTDHFIYSNIEINTGLPENLFQ